MTQQRNAIDIDKTDAQLTGGIVLMQPGDGIEMGRFRLREGVAEATMRAAWEEMTAGYLATRNGWRGQRLIRLEDGTFMDIAFAASLACSHAICDSWAGNAACDAFLRLIDPISMEFGSVI